MLDAKKLLLVPFALAACLCSSCFNTDGTEVPNEITGMIFNPDGTPAVDALVTAYPVGYVPGDTSANQPPKYTARTDSRGRYSLGKVTAGPYNILGSKDSLLSFTDSVLQPSKANANRKPAGLMRKR